MKQKWLFLFISDSRLKAFQKLDWPIFDLVEQKCYYRLWQQTKLKKKMLNNYLILNRYALKMCWDGPLLSVSRGVFLKIVCVFVSNLPFTLEHLVVFLRRLFEIQFRIERSVLLYRQKMRRYCFGHTAGNALYIFYIQIYNVRIYKFNNNAWGISFCISNHIPEIKIPIKISFEMNYLQDSQKLDFDDDAILTSWSASSLTDTWFLCQQLDAFVYHPICEYKHVLKSSNPFSDLRFLNKT